MFLKQTNDLLLGFPTVLVEPVSLSRPYLNMERCLFYDAAQRYILWVISLPIAEVRGPYSTSCYNTVGLMVVLDSKTTNEWKSDWFSFSLITFSLRLTGHAAWCYVADCQCVSII